jgi:hypothetical protein
LLKTICILEPRSAFDFLHVKGVHRKPLDTTRHWLSSLKSVSVGLAGWLDEKSQQETSDTILGKIKLTEYLIFSRSHLGSVYYCSVQNVDIVQCCD